MDRIKFFYNNLFKTGTITATSEHVNFPKENMQHRDFTKMWHSNHGAGSGWGFFLIVAAVNSRIDFEDNGTDVLVIGLDPGVYTADELAAEIEGLLELVSGESFTVEYLESSNKFKITNDVGNFKLLWNSGVNKARSIATTIGYDDSADDTGSDNYTADYARIHTEEVVACDFGSVKDIYAVIIQGHNISASGAVYVQFSSDNWTTIHAEVPFVIQPDILVLEWDTPKTYQYARIAIIDPSNSAGYVAMGTPYMGDQLQPETNFMGDGSIDRQDPSNVLPSENGQESSIQLDHFDLLSYTFHVKGLTEKGYFDALFDAMGNSKAFFYCEDPDLPLTTTKYVAINSFGWSGRRDVGLYTLSMQLREQR